MTYIEDGTCRLISRKQNQYKNFDPLAASLAKLPVKNARISQDLEGIVAKHKLAPYASTPQTWFKILNNDYTRKRGRKEMFENFRERNSAAVHDAQNP